jgi:hypothetical protein
LSEYFKGLFTRAGPLLQETIEVQERIFVTVPVPQRPHAVDVLAHRIAQVTAITGQGPKRFQRLIRVAAYQGARNRLRRPAFILLLQLLQRMAADNTLLHEPIQESL